MDGEGARLLFGNADLDIPSFMVTIPAARTKNDLLIGHKFNGSNVCVVWAWDLSGVLSHVAFTGCAAILGRNLRVFTWQ